MVDRMKHAVDRLADRLIYAASKPIVYTREGVVATFDVVVGRTEYERIDGTGGAVRYHGRDFILRSNDFQQSAVSWPPQEGDMIDDSADGRRYIVCDTDSGNCYEFDDGYHVMTRIHVKEIGGVNS